VPLREAPDRDEACARLVLFVLGAAHSGIVNADPNPDDALVLSDGRLAFVDFGAWREVSPSRVALGAAALEALLAEDPDAFAAALDELGWMHPREAPAMLALVHELLDGLLGPGPVRLDNEIVLMVRDRLVERAGAITSLVSAGALPPEDLWPARAILLLLSTIARVGATGRWPELARTAMREGWAAPASR
jgi:hypothetical protein